MKSDILQVKHFDIKSTYIWKAFCNGDDHNERNDK